MSLAKLALFAGSLRITLVTSSPLKDLKEKWSPLNFSFLTHFFKFSQSFGVLFQIKVFNNTRKIFTEDDL